MSNYEEAGLDIHQEEAAAIALLICYLTAMNEMLLMPPLLLNSAERPMKERNKLETISSTITRDSR